MLSIRLSRFGKTKKPHYRIVVVDKKKDPYGKPIETLGFYSPLKQPAVWQLNEEKLKYWLSQGAKPSDVIHNYLVTAGKLSAPKKRVVKIKKQATEKQEPPAPAKEAGA